MQTPDIWHKLHIHRAKIIVLLLLFATQYGLAQKAPVTMYRVEQDSKPLKYGFFLGFHQNSYGVKHSDIFETVALDDLLAINPQQNAGFNLGFMLDFRINDHFSWRLIPVKISLYQNEVDYHMSDGTIDTQLIETTRIEPGIFMKYRSVRRANARMYVIAGVSASMRSGKPRETDTGGLLISKTDLRAEIGVGLEKYFKFFKWSPEIRYARGLINVAEEQNPQTIYTLGIDRLVTHTFSLYLHFSD